MKFVLSLMEKGFYPFAFFKSSRERHTFRQDLIQGITYFRSKSMEGGAA